MRLTDYVIRSTFPTAEAIMAADDSLAKLEFARPPWVELSSVGPDEVPAELATAGILLTRRIASQASELDLIFPGQPGGNIILPDLPGDTELNPRELLAGVIQHILDNGGQYLTNEEGWGLRSPDGRSVGEAPSRSRPKMGERDAATISEAARSYLTRESRRDRWRE